MRVPASPTRLQLTENTHPGVTRATSRYDQVVLHVVLGRRSTTTRRKLGFARQSDLKGQGAQVDTTGPQNHVVNPSFLC